MMNCRGCRTAEDESRRKAVSNSGGVTCGTERGKPLCGTAARQDRRLAASDSSGALRHRSGSELQQRSVHSPQHARVVVAPAHGDGCVLPHPLCSDLEGLLLSGASHRIVRGGVEKEGDIASRRTQFDTCCGGPGCVPDTAGAQVSVTEASTCRPPSALTVLRVTCRVQAGDPAWRGWAWATVPGTPAKPATATRTVDPALPIRVTTRPPSGTHGKQLRDCAPPHGGCPSGTARSGHTAPW